MLSPASRRAFLATAAGLAAAAALRPVFASPAPRRAPETFLDWKPVVDGIDAALGAGGNSMLIRGASASALVDCKLAPFGPVLRREALARAGSPLSLVINTHHHADHSGGNFALSADAPILAHEKAVPRIRDQVARYAEGLRGGERQLGDRNDPVADAVRAEIKAAIARADALTADDFLPRQTFKDRKDLDAAGVKASVLHFGPGHTDNDLVVHLPGANVIHTGDLLFMGRHPFIDRGAGATTAGWISALRRIIELCDAKTRVIPGHGDLTDVAGLRGQIEYFERLREWIATLIKSGRSRDEVLKMKPPEAYANYGNPERALGAIFDELNQK